MLNSDLRNKIAERIKVNANLIKKNAMVTDSHIKMAALSVMMTISGRKNIKVFSDIDKALKWLKEN